MSLYTSISNFLNRGSRTLAAQDQGKDKPKRFLPYTSKAVSRVRQNINDWNNAINAFQAEEPKTYAIQLLYNEIMIDAHLYSQVQNRKQQIPPLPFSLKNASGEVNEEQTALLKQLPAYRRLNEAMWETVCFGYNLVELGLRKDISGEMVLDVITIPRTNVVPQTGLFYPDYTEDKTVKYREMPEFGTWVLEFNTGDMGLLNKAVPHILFKRFAQSCWSELCEIYGIPPRVMKTNTQDPAMLTRAEQMMRDMGAAAWFIIDETEAFEWAKGTDTNGDVYKNLITLCSNEVSLLMAGAVMGQDTKNGSRSKDEAAQEMLWQLVMSDMAMLEDYWTNIAIPALQRIGVLSGDIKFFEFDQAEDLAQLWDFTKGLLPYYTIPADWIKDKLGVEVSGERQQQQAQDSNSLSHFFD